ncbi:MAG: aspartate carbamoyltransferase, partial [bacterium]|nr:aspartate carbamoyltransferase [bacterium]
MTHLLSSDQLTREQLLELFEATKKLQEAKKLPQTMVGKILATVFLEPSTRTRVSFETSMLRLGGKVISIPNSECTSLTKGETLEDMGRMISTFADIIAVRTPNKGDVARFATHSSAPVINAGDGTGEHPTQNLLDLYTVWKERNGQLDGLTLGLMGDCKNSRVLRGFAKMASVFDISFIFIAPLEVSVDEDIQELLRKNGRSFREVHAIDACIAELDVLDVNRIRHEYFADKERAKEI